MKLGTVHRSGYLAGTSRASRTPGDLLIDHFDLAVLVSSWDPRCLCVTSVADLRADVGLVLLFDVRDRQGLRDAHDPALLGYCSKQMGTCVEIRGRSIDIHSTWREILSKIEGLWCSKRRPLRLFIDLSACPRFYSMAVLATCLGKGIASSVTMSYAEGLYPGAPPEQELAFTGGEWRTVPVPSLCGLSEPGRRRFYLVSVGFEGAKTLRAVGSADPERVSLLFPEPGIVPEYVARARDSNDELVQRYAIPDDQIVCAPAGDAIAAWAALNVASLERPETEDISYLCCGTKPHSIAMALRAMVLEYPTVLYNVPEEHKVVRTQPAGTYWRYDVWDVTALPTVAIPRM